MEKNKDLLLELNEMQRRIEVLERYVAISMSSSHANWNTYGGLYLPVNEVNDMIMGRSDWDPKKLNKGG